MKFVIAQNDKSPSFREGDEWHTESFDGEHYGLFLDDRCICIISSSQASFLNILKNDEDKISSIEITDGPITIQPIEAESFEYTRPTGEIDFKEKRMTRVELNKRKIEEAIKTLKKAGYKVNEMAIERPTAKKTRADAENKKLASEKKKLSYIMDNIFYGEEPDTGISSNVSNEEFIDLCDLAGIENEIPIKCYEIRLGRMEDRRSPYHSESWEDTRLGQHLLSVVGYADDYLDNYCPSLYLHFDKEVEEKMTDELADYLNEIEERLSNHPLIDHVNVSEQCIKFIMKPFRPNYDAYIKAIDDGFSC